MSLKIQKSYNKYSTILDMKARKMDLTPIKVYAIVDFSQQIKQSMY